MDDTGLVDFFSSLFELKKLAVVKRNNKEIQDVVLIVSSDNNTELLDQPSFGFKDSICSPKTISIEESESLIIKNRTKLYIGAIPFRVDNVRIWNYFAQFGALEYSYIIRKPEKNGKKGFGFVIFKNRYSLERALSFSHFFEGQKVICTEFSCKAKVHKNRNQPSPNAEFELQASPEVSEHFDEFTQKKLKTPLKRNHQLFLLEQSHPDFVANTNQGYGQEYKPSYLRNNQVQEENRMYQNLEHYSFDCNYLQTLGQRSGTFSSSRFPRNSQVQTETEIQAKGGLRDFQFQKITMRHNSSKNVNACYSCF